MRTPLLTLVALCAVSLLSCDQRKTGTRRVAFVSNGVDPFWNVCAAGARAQAKEMPLITQDSDAPGSDRVCFIGVDNYAAGREVGRLVKEVCPDGGKVAIFIGRLEQQNSRARRQGVIDELLDRDSDPARFDEVGAVPKGGKYEITGTLIDNFDQAQAKSAAEDTRTSPAWSGSSPTTHRTASKRRAALAGSGTLGSSDSTNRTGPSTGSRLARSTER